MKINEIDMRLHLIRQVHAEKARPPKRPLPSREDQLKTLKKGEVYDVLIIGGGATGAGCALDACTRGILYKHILFDNFDNFDINQNHILISYIGLKTALIEGDDFASGTSSRSTKLIHGGVRYLQKAIMQADIEQYRMVKEALHERASMIHNAPHLAHPLPIMLPVYT